MQNSDKLWLICRIAVVGMVAALLYHGVARMVLHQGYPYNTFLFKQQATFSDFTDFIPAMRAGSPYSTRVAVYFPFTYATLFPLIWLPPLVGVGVMILLFSAGLFCLAWNELSFLGTRKRAVAAWIVSFISYPFLICINRANIEMFVFLFVVGFVLLFRRGRYLSAAVLLACATAMKLYPGLLGLLLLKQRRYAAAALTAAVTLALTVLPAMAFPGGVQGSMTALRINLADATQSYVQGVSGIAFSSCYFSLLKQIAIALRLVTNPSNIAHWAQAATVPYTVVGLIGVAGVAVYVLAVERDLWKQVALIVFATILIPQISFDYRLIHVVVPLLLFVSAPRGTAADGRLYAMLFGLLLIPKAYFATESAIGIGVILNPLIMTVMAARIISTGLRTRGAVPVAAGHRA